MRVWCGKAGGFRGEDHGSVAGPLRRGGEEASKRGPRVSGRSALGAAERGERAGLACGRRGCGTRRAGPRAWTELTRRAALGRSVGRCGAVLDWVAEESWTGLPGFLGLGLVWVWLSLLSYLSRFFSFLFLNFSIPNSNKV